MGKIRTRFAPSPTGDLHIGSVRTALYAYALAKHYGGDFILRIEDTDKKREIVGAKERIKENLQMLGLLWDEYYEQSERVKSGIYQKAAEKLVAAGNAFYCQCSAKNAKSEGYSKILRDPCRDKKLTSGAIKLKVVDNEKISFSDYVLRKEISWDTDVVADTTLLKSDGFPTYHLAVVVDDNDMSISHALRGHDWMPSTPIHLLVYEHLGYELPQIGHLTDILDPDGGKLSKRKGSVTLDKMLSEGYLPEAIINFVMLLGWAPKDDRELFTLEQFVQSFDEKGFQKSNPVFNRTKLDWFNGEYIRMTSNEELGKLISDFTKGKYSEDLVKKLIPLTKERMRTLSDFDNLCEFFLGAKDIDKEILDENYKKHLRSAFDALKLLKAWEVGVMNESLMKVVKDNEYHTGKFFMDLRLAITGKKVSPPLNESMEILGYEESLARIEKLL